MVMKVVFTDLDGTLLDHDTYSFQTAKKSLQLLKNKGVPLIVCTSKTRVEIEYWRVKLGNVDPFISENGGGVFIPKDYFLFMFDYSRGDDEFYIIELGTKYDVLVKVFGELKKKFEIQSFADMNDEELAFDAHLDKAQAVLAKQREFDLPFRILNEKERDDVLQEIKKRKLKYTVGGRYYHLLGDNDKGQAVQIVTDLYREKYRSVYTIGIGDSENDYDMLDVVDSPYLVKQKDGRYASRRYSLADGVGPDGWHKVIEREFNI